MAIADHLQFFTQCAEHLHEDGYLSVLDMEEIDYCMHRAAEIVTKAELAARNAS